MRVDDIITLADRGEILDSRLILGAQMIRSSLGYLTREDFSPEDIRDFEKLVR